MGIQPGTNVSPEDVERVLPEFPGGLDTARPERNLTFDLLDHARLTPDAPALLLSQGSISYRQLNDAVWRFSQHLHDKGVKAGDVLGLTMHDETVLVLTLLAVIRLGATAFSIPRSATPAQRRDWAVRARINALATDKPDKYSREVPTLLVNREVAVSTLRQVDVRILAAKPAAPWLLITGSGTTGNAKLIPVYHSHSAARSKLGAYAEKLTHLDRIATLSHFDFSLPKFRLLDAFSVGAACALQIWESPDPVVQIRRRSISVVYATVFHAEALLARQPQGTGLILGSVRVFDLTSSIVSDELRQRVHHALCPNLYVRYATNETGPVCIAPPSDVFSVAGVIGKPLPGVQVRIVDPELRPMPQGTIGQIWIRSPGLVERYQDDDESTSQSFRDGWFTPGDLGRFTANGDLIYCGRADHMMIMNGINIYPAEIERVMTAHPDVRDAVVVPVRHAVHQDVPVCLVTLHPGRTAKEPALLTWAREKLGAHRPRYVLVVEQIPRTVQGKLARGEISKLIENRVGSVKAFAGNAAHLDG